MPGYVLNAHPGADVELTCFQCVTDLRYILGEHPALTTKQLLALLVSLVSLLLVGWL